MKMMYKEKDERRQNGEQIEQQLWYAVLEALYEEPLTVEEIRTKEDVPRHAGIQLSANPLSGRSGVSRRRFKEELFKLEDAELVTYISSPKDNSFKLYRPTAEGFKLVDQRRSRQREIGVNERLTVLTGVLAVTSVMEIVNIVFKTDDQLGMVVATASVIMFVLLVGSRAWASDLLNRW